VGALGNARHVDQQRLSELTGEKGAILLSRR
jgi:hypothetical protein